MARRTAPAVSGLFLLLLGLASFYPPVAHAEVEEPDCETNEDGTCKAVYKLIGPPPELSEVDTGDWGRKLEWEGEAQLMQEDPPIEWGSTTERRFKGKFVLGFITPWAPAGYKRTEKFRAKFTHLAPVWYSIRERGGKPWLGGGRMFIEQDWMKNVRTPIEVPEGADPIPLPKIVPRILLETSKTMAVELLQADLKDPDNTIQEDLIEAIVKEAVDFDLDGFTLHAYHGFIRSALAETKDEMADAKAHLMFVRFVSKLTKALEGVGKELILVVPPPFPTKEGEPGVRSIHANSLQVANVTAIAFATYGAGYSGRPAANSPVPWVKDNLDNLAYSEGPPVEMRDIMMGMNFGGWYHNTKMKQGAEMEVQDYIDKMVEVRPKVFGWLDNEEEHFFKWKTKDGMEHVVFYPTMKSVQHRLALASKYKVGVSIWEVGQGSEAFLYLL